MDLPKSFNATCVNTATTVCSPRECSAIEIDQFCRMVASGGEVDQDGLRARTMSAERLVFLRNGLELIGTAAIKNPGETYQSSVFAKARSSHSRRDFPHELGWVVVAKEHRNRGVSKILTVAALRAAGQSSLFATSRAENAPMQRTLLSYGFVADGEPYKSDWGDYLIQLFLLIR
jgi:predicted GNAT family N-acyltransferase